jgi:hypothetical protein
MPKRVRIDWRKRGRRKPPNTVPVARPSYWGNPFVVCDKLAPGTKIKVGRYYTTIAVPTVEEAIRRFAEERMTLERREQARRELRGKDLACNYEERALCHADVLLEIANSLDRDGS